MQSRIVFLFNREVMPLPYSKVTHHESLEKIWTVAPAVILCAIAGPSFSLLYALDEVNEPEINLKVLGNQWF